MLLKGVVTTSTCSSVISTNTTYVRNPGYPSSYTPSSAGTCSYTINKVRFRISGLSKLTLFKVSEDVCQLRLDFETMTGFYTGTNGACGVDDFDVSGQTGNNPPTICGTNTGYHSRKKIM